MLAFYLALLDGENDKLLFTQLYEQYEFKLRAVALPEGWDASADADIENDVYFRVIVELIRS